MAAFVPKEPPPPRGTGEPLGAIVGRRVAGCVRGGGFLEPRIVE
jgi:hypothetical protein